MEYFVFDLVSAFSPPTIAEKMLTDYLKNFNVKIKNTYNIFNYTRDIIDSISPLVFLIPIRGDMDLLEAHFAQLSIIAQHSSMVNRNLIFILHGDRHIWDDKDEKTPIYAKLKLLFFYSGKFSICSEKLDKDSFRRVAHFVIDELKVPYSIEEKKVSLVSRLLGKRPYWQAHKKDLGFYDETTGRSHLIKTPSKNRLEILDIIQELSLNSLELNHASLSSEQLKNRHFFTKHINSIGNSIEFKTFFHSFPSVEWVNLAANDLSDVNIAYCSPSVQHLYVHKNAINQLHFPLRLECRLHTLSMYRNLLTNFELPSDQIDIVKLNLGANPITNLSESLKKAQKLQFLGLARTNLEKLPEWLIDMPQLKELDISHMQHLFPCRLVEKLISRGVKIILEPGRNI